MKAPPKDDNPTQASSPLDRAARIEAFYELAEDGLLSDEALERSASLIEDSSWVPRWMSRALLLFGLALFSVGIVFFFAFNWDALPDLAKLGLIQVGFAGALAAGTLRDLHSVTSRVLLVVAGVLVGVFFAVFGQVYQTGADAWTLFALWSLVLLPLALLAGTQGAWVLWGTVTAIAGLTWFEHLPWSSSRVDRAFLQFMCVSLASMVVLAITEFLRKRGARLVEEFPWSRGLMLTTAFGAFALSNCLIGDLNVTAALTVVSLLLHVTASALAIDYYTRFESDIVGAAVVAISWLIVALRYLTDVVFDVFDDSVPGFFVMAVVTLALTAGLVATLRRLYASMQDQVDTEAP